MQMRFVDDIEPDRLEGDHKRFAHALLDLQASSLPCFRRHVAPSGPRLATLPLHRLNAGGQLPLGERRRPSCMRWPVQIILAQL